MTFGDYIQGFVVVALAIVGIYFAFSFTLFVFEALVRKAVISGLERDEFGETTEMRKEFSKLYGTGQTSGPLKTTGRLFGGYRDSKPVRDALGEITKRLEELEAREATRKKK